LIPLLVERWHVYALDLRGHGLSGRGASLADYHLFAFQRDALAFLSRQVGQPAVLCGHSWGGLTASACGGPGKEWLRGLVLVDPAVGVVRGSSSTGAWLEYFDWVRLRLLEDPRPEALATALLESGMRPGMTAGQALDWAETKSRVDPCFLEALTAGPVTQGYDLEAAIRAVECPLLLVHGNPARGGALEPQDVALIQRSARRLKTAAFADSGHDPHTDHPAEFVAQLAALLPE
jgi:pimeloyl-ACP methyl ester carboxylesterase